MNFISGITKSQEEAVREAQQNDAAMAAAAAAEEEQQQPGNRGSSVQRGLSNAVPPFPSHQPPAPPSTFSPERALTEAEATVQRAEQEAQKSHSNVAEDDVPDRILRTTVTSPKHNATPADRNTVLPVVEEAAEGSTMGERSRNSHISSTMTAESDGRPLTPAKDGQEMEPGFSNPIIGGYHQPPRRAPPPTPPKTGHSQGGLKPESADSGYGVTGASGMGNGLRSTTGSQRSLRVNPQISRDSLDKALPPLPRPNDHPAQGVS